MSVMSPYESAVTQQVRCILAGGRVTMFTLDLANSETRRMSYRNPAMADMYCVDIQGPHLRPSRERAMPVDPRATGQVIVLNRAMVFMLSPTFSHADGHRVSLADMRGFKSIEYATKEL
ncbi:unnamed protein product [Fusarium venenatum]|uniref:Uncharacterized protein n=1 Tax=Fusarium venenatum TaxID=56646 RepID=A0A2L2SV41_9HYPO|nr:uncharacterized protein FVRRES_12226 [Fusarium venenatum]CEI39535.1 unnamed protein product [Fusarium venenatum]